MASAGARAYSGVWGCAPSGVQGQSGQSADVVVFYQIEMYV